MGPPTTFTRNRAHVVTILSRQHGVGLPHAQKTHCALTLARNCRTHAEACKAIIAHGLAENAAEADALIYEAETENQS